MSCPHLSQARLPPKNAVVHREECTRCFDSDESDAGLFVCLSCFNGGCAGTSQHAQQHFEHTRHPLALHIKKTVTQVEESVEAPKQEITTLGVGVPGGLQLSPQNVEFAKSAYCFACKQNVNSPQLDQIATAIIETPSWSFRGEEQAWALALEVCEHGLCLQQNADAPILASKSLAHCQQCDVNSHLWLCLTCGALGCSRKNYDGTGGNGHAIAHYQATKHPMVCKMGTITPDGKADIYCYACDDGRLDPQLTEHLGHFGINVATQEKTEKSQIELELEKNKSLNLNQVLTKDGKEEQLLFGPGHTGLVNLGNSCYMASVFQTMFSLPNFQSRYGGPEAQRHLATCRSENPSECFQCQMAKLAEGLLSGRYAKLPVAPSAGVANLSEVVSMDTDQPKTPRAPKKAPEELQPGIPPRMIARLITRNHPEFRSKQQQDALEFLHYFLEQVEHQERVAKGVDPSQQFNFKLEDRLECLSCHRVRYQSVKASEIAVPIPKEQIKSVKDLAPTAPANPEVAAEAAAAAAAAGLSEKEIARQKKLEADRKGAAVFSEESKSQVPFASCLSAWAEPNILDYQCPECRRRTQAKSTVRFASYPEVLLVQVRRFVYDEWLPRKVGVEISVPDHLDLAELRGKGKQAGELEFPSAASAGAKAQPQPDPAIVAGIVSMGFSENAAARAALAVQNAGMEQASNWLFGHLDDANINDPLPAASASAPAGPSVDEGAVAELVSMGFEDKRVRYALGQTANNTERALDWLVSHMDDPLPSEQPAAPAASSAPAAAESKEDPRPPKYELFAFITHVGPQMSVGHYHAHILRDGKWVCFNDQKVFVSSEPPRGQAYLYFFRRVQ